MLHLLLLLQAQAPAACADAPTAARPFAGNLADSGRIFRGSFSADGRTLYYFRKTNPDAEEYRILVSREVDGRWSDGMPLDLGGDFSDLYPSVSPDGRRLVFTSYRPAPGDTASKPNAYLWYADREGDHWGTPRFIAPASRFGNYHSGPTIGADYSIRFHRLSADWHTRWTLVTRWDGQRYGAASEDPEDPARRWKGWRSDRYHVWGGQLAPGGDWAVLDISPLNRGGRRGPAEVWVSVQAGDDWTEPVAAGGAVNDAGWANFVTFHPDGCRLVFVRGFSGFYTVGIAALLQPTRRP